MPQCLTLSKQIVLLIVLLFLSSCNSNSVSGDPDASPITRDAATTNDLASKTTVVPDASARDLASPMLGKPCYSDNGDSCVCDSFSGPLVTVCSATSVLQAADESSGCCLSSSSLTTSCQCVAYVCLNDSAGRLCTCERVGNTHGTYATGTRATTCPAPTSGQICCMSTGWPRFCSCSLMAACGASQTQVTSCSAADVAAICPKGETVVPVCL